MDQILAAATPPHQAPLVFLAETGARVGEAKWLTWDDVDFEHRLIHIRPKEGWKPKSGDERVLRKWIGHVDREVLDWYYHLADPESQAAMRRLSDAAKRNQQNGSTDSSSAQSQHKPKGGKNDESAK